MEAFGKAPKPHVNCGQLQQGAKNGFLEIKTQTESHAKTKLRDLCL